MAGSRSFTSVSRHHLGTGSLPGQMAAANYMPWSMSGWLRPSSAMHDHCLFSLVDLSSNNDYWYWKLNSTASLATGSQAAIRDGSGVYINPDSSRAWVVNEWVHMVMTCDNDGDIVAYLDGVSDSAASSKTPDNIDAMAIGALVSSTSYDHTGGDISQCALWDSVLTQEECLALSRGASPLKIRPEELNCYWPLWENSASDVAEDIWGGFNLTPYEGATSLTTTSTGILPNDNGPPVELWWPGRGRTFFHVPSTGATTVSVSVINVPLAVPSPTLDMSLTVAPSAVNVPLTVPSPTLSMSLTVSVSAINIPLVVPSPTVDLSLTVAPSVVNVPLAVPTPTIDLTLTVAPSTINVPITVPTVGIAQASPQTVTPSVINIPITVPEVVVQQAGAQTVTASVINIPLVVHGPAIRRQALVGPPARTTLAVPSLGDGGLSIPTLGRGAASVPTTGNGYVHA